MREWCYANVLFHEMGHHIDATVLPEYREKEDVADSWIYKLYVPFFRKKYWYLMPVRKFLARFFKALSRSMQSSRQ